MDITTAFSYGIKSGWLRKNIAGLLTMKIKGAFAEIQKGRLCHELWEQR